MPFKLDQQRLQHEKALKFHALHHQATALILPNAWDALSAKIFEMNGAEAIGTTSAGIAAILGYKDGQKVPKDQLLMMLEHIVQSVAVPVSIDLEAGYGNTPFEVAQMARNILEIGAVGINLEDADPHCPGRLYDISEQIEKIAAIKEVAARMQIPLFLNARTDIYWLNLLSSHQQLEKTIERLNEYIKAGADGVFVPGVTELRTIAAIAKAMNKPLNVLGGSWIDDVMALKTFGVSRVSIGSSMIRASTAYVRQAANQLLRQHNFKCLHSTLSYEEFNSFFV